MSGSEARFVSAKSPLLAGKLKRVGERVLIAWDDERVDAEAWLQVTPAAKSTAGVLTMAKVDPAADFSFDYEDLAFKREHDCD